MKNKRRSRIGHLLAGLFNVRFWVDWQRIKSSFHYLSAALKKLFVPQSALAVESFEVAKTRLNLTEEDLSKRKKGLLRLSIMMSIFAILFFFYGVYNLITGGFLGAGLSFIVMCIAWILAFRYHFWYFQIKMQKLGCSVQEWFQWLRKAGMGGE